MTEWAVCFIQNNLFSICTSTYSHSYAFERTSAYTHSLHTNKHVSTRMLTRSHHENLNRAPFHPSSLCLPPFLPLDLVNRSGISVSLHSPCIQSAYQWFLPKVNLSHLHLHPQSSRGPALFDALFDRLLQGEEWSRCLVGAPSPSPHWSYFTGCPNFCTRPQMDHLSVQLLLSNHSTCFSLTFSFLRLPPSYALVVYSHR